VPQTERLEQWKLCIYLSQIIYNYIWLNWEITHLLFPLPKKNDRIQYM